MLAVAELMNDDGGGGDVDRETGEGGTEGASSRGRGEAAVSAIQTARTLHVRRPTGVAREVRHRRRARHAAGDDVAGSTHHRHAQGTGVA